jgi:hypothetical protein
MKNNTKQTILKTYIRDNNNNPRGVAVAVRNDDRVSYGFSLLNNYRDKFNKKIGTAIAINRASQTSYELPEVPERETLVLDAFINLEKRSLKYFKDINPDNIVLKGHLSTLPWEE